MDAIGPVTLCLFLAGIIGWLMGRSRLMRELIDRSSTRPVRSWTEDCRVYRHDQCEHIGVVTTVGLLGRRRFETCCPCACHWGCPAEAADPSGSAHACTCSDNGHERQHNFEAATRRPTRPLGTISGHPGDSSQ